jgi:hypothetical protein
MVNIDEHISAEVTLFSVCNIAANRENHPINIRVIPAAIIAQATRDINGCEFL